MQNMEANDDAQAANAASSGPVHQAVSADGCAPPSVSQPPLADAAGPAAPAAPGVTDPTSGEKVITGGQQKPPNPAPATANCSIPAVNGHVAITSADKSSGLHSPYDDEAQQQTEQSAAKPLYSSRHKSRHRALQASDAAVASRNSSGNEGRQHGQQQQHEQKQQQHEQKQQQNKKKVGKRPPEDSRSEALDPAAQPAAAAAGPAQQPSSSADGVDDADQEDMQRVKRRRPAVDPASSAAAAAGTGDQQQQVHRQHPADHSHIRKHHAVHDVDGEQQQQQHQTEGQASNPASSDAVPPTPAALAGSPGKQQKHSHSVQQPHKRSKGQSKQLLSFTEDEDVDEAPATPPAAIPSGSSSGSDEQQQGGGTSSQQQQQQLPKPRHSQLGGLARATASRFAQEIKQAAAAARMVFKPSSAGSIHAGSGAAAAAATAAGGRGGAAAAAAAAGSGAVLVDEDEDPRAAAGAAAAALSQIHFGFATARGHRPYMEDRHTIITTLNPATASQAAAALEAADSHAAGGGEDGGAPPSAAAAAAANGNAWEVHHQHAAAAVHHDGVGRSYAAIFDGHNGAGAAETAARKLHLLLASHPALRLYRGESGPPAVVRQEEREVAAALKYAFRQVDDLVLGVARREGTRDGATALVLLRLGNALYAAHAGDSRAVLCRDSSAYRLTEDHKPHLPHERSRIEQAGGRVDFQRCWRVVVEPRDGRPGSGLAVSRSLGDLDFKEPYRFVECEPDVTRLVLQARRDSFVVLGSDGLWDVLSDTDAVITAAHALKNFSLVHQHHNSSSSAAGGGGAAAEGAGVGVAVAGRQRLHHNNPHARAAAAAGFATAELPDNLVYSDAAATAAAEALLAESMRRGTMDNVTVIVMLLQWS